MGRNKAPSEITIRMLCSKAAGMCEFEGCDRRLFYDNVTHKEFNNSFVAHIVASSQNGPRGDKTLSPQLSDKLDNLMLMCADHHKMIDDFPEIYTVACLTKMKENHKKKVEEICELFYVQETELVIFTSPIKGIDKANVDISLAAKAVLPYKKPHSNFGYKIDVVSHEDYCSAEYWNSCCSQLKKAYNTTLYNYFIQNNINISLFPLAPMPLIIKLGELIGDKVLCDIYQKNRTTDTWNWATFEKTNDFFVEHEEYDTFDNIIALVISLTSDIQYDRINFIHDYKIIYKIKSKVNGVDCIKSPVDLSEFWHVYQNTMEQILISHGKKCEIHLFPSLPVSASFEIGRRYMKGVYPKITIYDDMNGFFKTIKLGDD